MAENKDLFDTYNLADIPQELKAGLKQDGFADEIIELFNIAGASVELHVDAVTVAHYRKYIANTGKQPRLKNAIMAKLYAMGRDPESPIESVSGKKGTYRLKSSTVTKKIDTMPAESNYNMEATRGNLAGNTVI